MNNWTSPRPSMIDLGKNQRSPFSRDAAEEETS